MDDAASLAGSGTAEFGSPVVIDGGDSIPPPKPPTKNQASRQSAATIAELFDLGLTFGTGYPLTIDERRDFVRDLAAVMRKYDVPDLPYAEEVALAGTTIRIIVPRILHKRGVALPDEPEEPGEVLSDLPSVGKEGVGENSPDQEADVSPFAVGTAAARALS